jgi:hypothetical protein
VIKKLQKCVCGALIVLNDGHLICENYLENIKQGIKEQQKIIEELTGGEII